MFYTNDVNSQYDQRQNQRSMKAYNKLSYQNMLCKNIFKCDHCKARFTIYVENEFKTFVW